MNKSRKAIIKIFDEINVAILGLDEDHYEYFWKLYGIHVKGYFFNPLYKMNRWDGKARFFTKNGKTSINLLPEMLPTIKSWGYTVSLSDARSSIDFDIPEIDENLFSDRGITLAKHQVDAANAITANNGGIAVLATGSGKSYLIATLAYLYEAQGLNSLTIVPNKDLVTQTADEMSLFGLDIGLYYGEVKDPNHTHVVSTWQTLQNSPELISLFKCIIIDECHGTASNNNVLKTLLLERGNNAYIRIGVTGTLPEEPAERMSVTYVLGQQVYEKPAADLMDSGWLAALKLVCYILEEDFKERWEFFVQSEPVEAAKTTYKKFKSSYFPDYASEQAFIKANKSRTSVISEMIQNATRNDGNSFVLVNGVAFGKRLAKMIPNAIFVHGQDESEVRKKIYALFSEHDDVIVVTTFQLASTGLNIKRIFNLFLVDAGKSFIRVIQSIGRGLRKAADKDTVNVYDISSDLKYAAKHFSDRKSHYTKQKYVYTVHKLDYSKLDS